jgi:hypothetical protein
MAEVNQYALPLKELLEVLIKHIDIHEGEWSLAIGFQVGVGGFGPTPEQTFPGATVTVHQVGIQRFISTTETPGPGSIIVDAAKVNPKKK